ncbi:MAG: hypothetical protein CM15mP55_1400 [Hyphomicrobiales bacterium]|nr:MAG: hypothetical protein CM15mP55_1400 [Hyphomicrobiales bacterium]
MCIRIAAVEWRTAFSLMEDRALVGRVIINRTPEPPAGQACQNAPPVP